MDMPQRLAEANERYKRVVNGTDRPAPGTYQMQLRSAIFRESRAGKWLVRWTFTLLDGAHAGEECSDVSALESDSFVPLRLCVQRVEQLGFSAPADIWGYQELCPRMTAAAPVVLADLSYDSGYDRINITQLLMASSAAATTTAPPTPAPPTAAPSAPPPPAPLPAAPTQAVAPPAIGDTVQCKDAKEDGTFMGGVVDDVKPDGTLVIGIDDQSAFNATADEVVVTARAAVPAPAQVVPAPAAAPLPVPVPAPTPALAPPPAPPDPQLEQLLILAKTYGVDANDLMTKAEVVAALNECAWRADYVTDPADVVLLGVVGIVVDPAPAPAPAPEPVKPKRAVTKRKAAAKGKKKTVTKRKKQA